MTTPACICAERLPGSSTLNLIWYFPLPDCSPLTLKAQKHKSTRGRPHLSPAQLTYLTTNRYIPGLPLLSSLFSLIYSVPRHSKSCEDVGNLVLRVASDVMGLLLSSPHSGRSVLVAWVEVDVNEDDWATIDDARRMSGRRERCILRVWDGEKEERLYVELR